MDLKENVGKAGAVQQGMLYAQAHFSPSCFAYLDADLSTSLEECFSLAQNINPATSFVFGSRILKADNTIKENGIGFLSGGSLLRLFPKCCIAVYDTQCGCKIFDAQLISTAFTADFTSRWLFDVEIFYRLMDHYGKTPFCKKQKKFP